MKSSQRAGADARRSAGRRQVVEEGMRSATSTVVYGR